MARIEMTRRAAADPAGVALLLSGPGGRELWPGPAVSFCAPVRSGLGFTVELAADVGGGTVHGHVGITPASDGPGESQLRLVLRTQGPAGEELRGWSDAFLADLAETAYARSSAA